MLQLRKMGVILCPALRFADIFRVRHMRQQKIQQRILALVSEGPLRIAPLAVILIIAAVWLPAGDAVLQRHAAALADELPRRTQQRIDGYIEQCRKQLQGFGIRHRFTGFPAGDRLPGHKNLFRQFFLSIPRDLENAAIVDGCSWPGVFFRIIMPNSKPAIATVIILSFRSTWNSFLWPQLVLQTDRLWTWTLALKILSESETNQAVLLAGSVISILPILIIYLACQKYFVNSQVSAGFGGT